MLNMLRTTSPEEVRRQRFSQLMDQIVLEQDALVNGIKRDLAEKRARFDKLTDIGPSETTSLRVVDDKFSPADFVKEVHSLKLEIAETEIELQIAVETYDDIKKAVEPTDEIPKAVRKKTVKPKTTAQ